MSIKTEILTRAQLQGTNTSEDASRMATLRIGNPQNPYESFLITSLPDVFDKPELAHINRIKLSHLSIEHLPESMAHLQKLDCIQ
jgi:hypothetical protein